MAVAWQEIFLYILFVVGTAATLFAFFWGRRLRRSGGIPAAVRNDPAFSSFLDNGRCVGGEIEVEAPSVQTLLDLLALHLENPMSFMQSAWGRQGGVTGQIHVERTQDSEITFTASGLNIVAGIVRGEIGSPGRTVRVRWALQLSGGTTLITLGQCWAIFISLPASVIAPILIYKYVLTSPNPAVRGQFLQALQICQVLWEPYLFMGLASTMARSSGRYLEMVISAAAYEARTGRPAAASLPSGMK